MSRELKLVNRGLHDAVDPAFAPDGSLTKAVNCRYRPGSITLWQAEGRSQAGSAAGVNGIAGIAWDSPRTPELVYWDGAEYQLWPASVDPDDARYSTSTDFSTVATFTTPGDLPWEVVSVPGAFFIFDGARPKYITNYARYLPPPHVPVLVPGKAISPAGILAFGPRFDENRLVIYGDVGSINATRTAGSSTLSPNAGYWYWATYATNNVSDAARNFGGPIEGGVRESESSMPWSVRSGTSAADGDISVVITLGPDAYNNNKWSYVNVYRNKDGTLVSPNLIIAPAFPNGIRVRSIPKSSFTSSTASGRLFYTYTFLESSSNFRGNETPFNSVVANAAGRTTGTSRDNELPYRVSCGDVFLDCLMVNDLDSPRTVWYSYPGEYQSFPRNLYFITMNSTDADKVTAIKSLGQLAIVLTSNSCWRVNDLPTSADFDFSHGEVQTILAESTGAPRPQAVTKAHLPAPYGTVCCWVSEKGVYATNGFDVTELTSHINWKGMNVKLDNCNLVDDPSNHRLVLHDGNSNLYYLHYHPAHITDNFLAVTGPVLRPGGVTHLFRFYTEGGKPQVATLDNVGKFFYEGVGNEDESTGDAVAMEARTREYYPGGIGSSGSVPKVLAHIAAIPTLSGSYGILLEQGPDADHLEISVLDKITRQLFVSSKNIFTESLTFIMAGSGSQDFGVNAVGWDWDDHGTT